MNNQIKIIEPRCDKCKYANIRVVKGKNNHIDKLECQFNPPVPVIVRACIDYNEWKAQVISSFFPEVYEYYSCGQFKTREN